MGDKGNKILVVHFFRSDAGNEPVRNWLQGLSREDKKIIGEDIKTVELGWPIGMPVCRSLGNGIREVRSDITGGRIARTLFCIDKGLMILLHGFIKKTRKTPKSDLDLARKRKRRLDDG